MSTITPQTVAAAGTNETLQAATTSDTIANATNTTRYRVVTSGTAVTVTFTAVIPCSQGVTHNVAWGPLPATGTSERPVPPQCIDPSTGNVAVAHSVITGVTVGAFQ
jgi:hypothetical protein